MLRNRTLLAVSFAVCAAYAGIGMVSPVFVLYARSRGASLGVISAMASAYLIANFAAQYPSGWLADRLGRRPVMMAGLLTQAALSFSYLLITDPLVFVGLRVAEGLAAAAILPSARALVADAIPAEQRGAAFGLFGAFFNAGFLIGPALGGLLATTGYASAFIGAVGFRLLAMLIVLTLVPRALRPGQSAAMRPQITGLLTRQLKLLFTLPLIGAYVLAFGDYLFVGFDLTLLPVWLHDHLGASVAVIRLAYMAWAVPSILVSPIGGRIADRSWRSGLIFTFGLGQVPLYLMYGLANSAWLIVGLFAVHAVLYAFIQPAVDAHVAAASNPNARATIQGMYSTVGLAGAFVGASGFTSLYAIDFRLPLYAQGVVYSLCVVVGGSMIYRAEARGLVAGPHLRHASASGAPSQAPMP